MAKTSSKDKRPKKRRRFIRPAPLPGDPITVGGGGGGPLKGRKRALAAEFTFIFFDPTIYVQDPNFPPKKDNQRFTKAGSSITSLELDTGGTLSLQLKGSKPLIRCNKTSERIQIHDEPIGIEFNPDEFEEQSAGYYVGDTEISSVDLKGGSLKRDKSFKWKFTIKK